MKIDKLNKNNVNTTTALPGQGITVSERAETLQPQKKENKNSPYHLYEYVFHEKLQKLKSLERDITFQTTERHTTEEKTKRELLQKKASALRASFEDMLFSPHDTKRFKKVNVMALRTYLTHAKENLEDWMNPDHSEQEAIQFINDALCELERTEHGK